MERQGKHFRKRDAILTCLRGTTSHPSADWIYDRLRSEHSDISLATVYRNLSMFKKQGVIASLGTVNGIERFDGNTDPHVHFICTRCDAVRDLMDIRVPQSLCSEASTLSGGQISGCQLSFSGVCRECAAKNVI